MKVKASKDLEKQVEEELKQEDPEEEKAKAALHENTRRNDGKRSS